MLSSGGRLRSDADDEHAHVRQQADDADDAGESSEPESVELSRTPGTNAAAMTTKSKMFQPLLKKSCGRRP